MLPPEALRILLLIGLAATAYMLIQAWNEDYIRNAAPVTYSDAPELSSGGSVEPSIEPVIAAGGSDIPDESLLSGEPQAPVVASSEARSDRLVTVTTPTLKVWIDRLGGDVVRVQLPKYPVESSRPDVPYLLVENGGGHTYVAQSGLMGPDGVDRGQGRPMYTASTPNLEVAEGSTGTLRLTATHNGLSVEKRFTFRAEDYLVDVAYEMPNSLDRPLEAALFAQIKRDDKDPVSEEAFSFGPQSYVGAAITTPEERYLKLEFDDLEDGAARHQVTGGWVAFLQHYFLSAWIANPDELNTYFGQRRSDGLFVFGYTAPKQTVAVGDVGVWKTSFYAGPKDQHRLEEISPNLNLTVDYGFLWWLAVPLFEILAWLNGFFGNWGVSIIMLTVLVKIVLYPLFNVSYKSMAKMRKLAPEMKRLQERYSDDRQKLQQEMMKLYQKEGANPLGGCLPMLLPMPVFLALYWVLWESVELRQAPFMLWLQDLSAMDPYFVLPLLMGGTMYVQQLLSPQMGDPMQQRMMRLMPIMFTVLFLFFPAGLVLYWLVNSVLSVAQQWYVTRQTEAA